MLFVKMKYIDFVHDVRDCASTLNNQVFDNCYTILKTDLIMMSSTQLSWI